MTFLGGDRCEQRCGVRNNSPWKRCGGGGLMPPMEMMSGGKSESEGGYTLGK